MTSHAPALPLDRLRGTVAVVTGASRGLGAGLAERFAELGLSVGLCATTEPQLPRASRGVGVTASVDVADALEVERFGQQVVDALGPIDLWVNNAGVLDPMGPHRDHDADEVARALAVNIGGVANGTRTFSRLAAAAPRTGGRRVLVNVSSGAARSVYPGWSIYGATKAAVDHFTEIVAAEEPDLICHAVAPGVIDTDMQAQIRTHDARTFPAIDRFRELHRTGAWSSPAWVADHLLGILAGTLVPDDVVYRVPAEPHP